MGLHDLDDRPATTRRRPAGLYEADFHRWTQEQARALDVRDHAALDIRNLIDEVESVGRSQRNAIESHLRVLLMHLLKFQVQPERASPSWRHTLRAQRGAITRLIRRNPSLRGYPAEILAEVYRDAVEDAARETRLPQERFPGSCPFPLARILDPDFEP
ncbi:DUF29 domain-containing protein [Methylobacterium oryzihabitans]|uniref:DUF29 domain-containing protein n=1 Tax=Methylobacterium oryzihabitans TaxID=2499852 RepID=A0A437PHX8_9HYPH|nr:DUF29 domain-containing protein [Methylobacterium oryzihabitans]RVU21863.1 DUF29 domain-containing protein [Methylobacterium oryzihabitans]